MGEIRGGEQRRVDGSLEIEITFFFRIFAA
jgi:hypothetical protein